MTRPTTSSFGTGHVFGAILFLRDPVGGRRGESGGKELDRQGSDEHGTVPWLGRRAASCSLLAQAPASREEQRDPAPATTARPNRTPCAQMIQHSGRSWGALADSSLWARFDVGWAPFQTLLSTNRALSPSPESREGGVESVS